MGVIKTIEEFKLRCDDSDTTIVIRKLSAEVLEYYIENYIVDWYGISLYQTLSDAFIEKYKDKLNWYYLLNNNNIKLTYDIINNNVYYFNLYGVYTQLKSLTHKGLQHTYYITIFEKLIELYPTKYNIDRITYEFNK